MNLHEHLAHYGTDELSTEQLLAFALESKRGQRKALELASRILATHGAKWLRNACAQELEQAGFTKVQAARLVAICELTKRLVTCSSQEHPKIESADDIATLLRPLMAHLPYEEFRVLLLDAKLRVIHNIALYKGTIDSCSIRSAEILRQACIRNCQRMIVAHNHPSGDPSASPEDVNQTKKLVEAGKLLDVEVLDHIIIGNPGYVSLKDQFKWS